MAKKCLALLMVILVPLIIAGCGKKNATTNQSIKTLIHGYQQSMLTFFDIKNLQDSSVLVNQINDSMRKVEESKKKLEQISGLTENVTDDRLRAEIMNFIDLGREREKLAIKYMNDIRRDLDYRYKNPDSQINITSYIVNIPNHLLDLEYSSEQSVQRLDTMLNKK